MNRNLSLPPHILICLPKPTWSPAGIIWSISGSLMKQGYNVCECQYFYLQVPQLFSSERYLALISSDLMDLNDYTNSDRATVIRAAQAFPKNIYIVWDKKQLWEPTDTANPTNLLVWTDSETDEVTKKVLKLLSVHDDGHHDRRRGRS